MGLIEAYRRYRTGVWLAAAAVVITLLGMLYAAGPGAAPAPGNQMQIIQIVLAISVGGVFAYAIRPGNGRAGWLLWWIPVVVFLVSIPVQLAMPELIAAGTSVPMQLVLFLSLTWLVVLAAPLSWFALYLPVEFFVRAFRGFGGDDKRLVIPRLMWGSLLGAVTFGGVLVSVLMSAPQTTMLVPRMLEFMAQRAPGLGFLTGMALVFMPLILGGLAVILLVITFVGGGGTARIVDAFVLSVPPLEKLRQPLPAEERSEEQRVDEAEDGAEGEASESDDGDEPAEPLSRWTGWNPVWLWHDVPGAVLMAVSTVVVTLAVAIMDVSGVYIHHLLLPVFVYVGPFTWGVALAVLTAVVLGLVLHGRHFRGLWLLGWVALAVTVSVGFLMSATGPTVGGLEILMIAIITVFAVVLSCAPWLFLVVPVQLITTSVVGLLLGHTAAVSGLLLGLCLGSGGIGVVSGFFSVDLPSGGTEAERQSAIVASLLGTPGDYTVASEPALWIARLSIGAMIVFGVAARSFAGGKGKLQAQLNESALGTKRAGNSGI